MMRKKLAVTSLLMLLAPVLTSQAANVAVDCTKKASVNTALGKLDRSVANTVTITGTCIEDVVIDGHRDVTIVGNAVAGLTATVLSGNDATTTLMIKGNSRATLQSLTITGGSNGVYCDDRSTCILKNIVIQGGANGLSIQKQSSADVLDGSITGSGNIGIGVFGASSVNVRSDASANPVQITNHAGLGIQALDGSFVRVDGATISGNGTGASGDRGVVLKLLGTNITNNINDGVVVRASTLQIGGSVTNNGANGIWVRRLGYVFFQPALDANQNPILVPVTGNNPLQDPNLFSLKCDNVTSITQNRSGATLDNTNCTNVTLN